jgi:hypothetical protein
MAQKGMSPEFQWGRAAVLEPVASGSQSDVESIEVRRHGAEIEAVFRCSRHDDSLLLTRDNKLTFRTSGGTAPMSDRGGRGVTSVAQRADGFKGTSSQAF